MVNKNEEEIDLFEEVLKILKESFPKPLTNEVIRSKIKLDKKDYDLIIEELKKVDYIKPFLTGGKYLTDDDIEIIITVEGRKYLEQKDDMRTKNLHSTITLIATIVIASIVVSSYFLEQSNFFIGQESGECFKGFDYGGFRYSVSFSNNGRSIGPITLSYENHSLIVKKFLVGKSEVTENSYTINIPSSSFIDYNLDMRPIGNATNVSFTIYVRSRGFNGKKTCSYNLTSEGYFERIEDTGWMMI